MATTAQVTANAANAQRSTGPKTEAGKAASSRNSARHGLSSREFVVDEASRREFNEFMTALFQELNPVGAFELDLFRNFAHAAWTLRRCRIADTELSAKFNLGLRRGWRDDANAERLKLIALYARRAERAYFRFLQELRRVQTERLFRQTSRALLETVEDPAPSQLSPLAETLPLHRAVQNLTRTRQAAAQSDLAREVESFLAPPSGDLFPFLAAQPGIEQTNPIRSCSAA